MNKNLPRDVVLYLLSIVTLVASAVSFGILVFQYINIYFPDLINDYYFSASSYYGTIRQSLATLIVIFPVYVWVSRFLKKDIEVNPEKRDLRIRKWLLYLTLLVASLVIIGDLVTLINTYLNGEITSRFILKVLTIIFISGSVFYHYYFELREAGSKKREFVGIGLYSWFVIGVVVFAVVSGFFIAGSPQNQRIIRFDEIRVRDLSSLQSYVINYWQKKNELPSNLDQVANDILGILIPRDPKTGVQYEYKILSNLKFELCATFEIANFEQQGVGASKPVPVRDDNFGYEMNVWRHGAERTCFQRTIDPDIFKIK